MCDHVWADVCCIRYVEHFSDLFVNIRQAPFFQTLATTTRTSRLWLMGGGEQVEAMFA